MPKERVIGFQEFGGREHIRDFRSLLRGIFNIFHCRFFDWTQRKQGKGEGEGEEGEGEEEERQQQQGLCAFRLGWCGVLARCQPMVWQELCRTFQTLSLSFFRRPLIRIVRDGGGGVGRT